VWAGIRGFDQLRRNPYPITLGKLKLEAVEAKEHLQLMIFGHSHRIRI
jgi:predicted phosphodiesterase